MRLPSAQPPDPNPHHGRGLFDRGSAMESSFAVRHERTALRWTDSKAEILPDSALAGSLGLGARRGPVKVIVAGASARPSLTPRPPLPPALTPTRERGRHRPKHLKKRALGVPPLPEGGSAGGRGGQGVRVFGRGKTPPPPDFDGTLPRSGPEVDRLAADRAIIRPWHAHSRASPNGRSSPWPSPPRRRIRGSTTISPPGCTPSTPPRPRSSNGCATRRSATGAGSPSSTASASATTSR